jgi:hypothetical protein
MTRLPLSCHGSCRGRATRGLPCGADCVIVDASHSSNGTLVKLPRARISPRRVVAACLFAGGLFAAGAQAAAQSVTLLPRTHAFSAPLADPLAPRFSGGLAMTDIFTRPLMGNAPDAVRDAHAYRSEPHALVNLGGLVPVAGLHFGDGCKVSASLEAMVLARFRLRTTEALSNDWWVGLPIAATCGAASAQVRIYHRSDHLNDEFLLLNEMNRHGPVQDGVDATVAWQHDSGARVYAGAGHIVRGYWGPWGSSAHGGVEFTRPFRADASFIGGAHVRATAVSDWRVQRVLAGGVEYRGSDGVLRVLLREMRGPSTVGEFFMNDEHLLGLEFTVIPGGSRAF